MDTKILVPNKEEDLNFPLEKVPQTLLEEVMFQIIGVVISNSFENFVTKMAVIKGGDSSGWGVQKVLNLNFR